MQTDNYAMLKTDSNYVENTIVADDKFSLSGFKLIKIEADVFCQPSMYFNDSDGLFYDDAEFTSINDNSVT
ncbi:hypothetical protein NJH77_26140 [Serratia fonticola]|uniref:hypothetical protein n=1 Tax=Serratia fonticola TaxID=47917 RepID=UPI002097758F|nr:hypothetical protein [Serratia fonticola]MCO7512726.1 hypothetical protein [Serratia fonticola]